MVGGLLGGIPFLYAYAIIMHTFLQETLADQRPLPSFPVHFPIHPLSKFKKNLPTKRF